MRFARLAAALLLAVAAGALAEPLSVERLFQKARFAAMTISPDGKTIAALAPVGPHQNLVLLDAATKKPTPLTNFSDRDIVSVSWVNSRRLMVRTGSIGVRDFDFRGGGLFAIDIDGSDGRMLSEGGSDERAVPGTRVTPHALSVIRPLPGEGDDIIAQDVVYAAEGAKVGELFRVNTRTGRRTSISFGKPDSGNSERWIVDRNGVARVLVVSAEGRLRTHYRAGPDAPWQKLDEFSQLEQRWTPLAVADDDKTLLVADRRTRDKAAIVSYDPATHTFGAVLAEHPQVDLNNLILSTDGSPVGVRFEADRHGVAWFDEGLARLQAIVDKGLPNTINVLNWSRDRERVVVYAYSDVLPGSFYLLDTRAGKMEWLVDVAPQIRPRDMSAMRPVHYAARDGLDIPAYLTLPKDGPEKNLPMVVVVHGGPWVAGQTWRFSSEAQFLASRGYAVLQPNFRGTTRYGWKHFSSSFGQWGLAMQDDITDGVKWAIEQGIADPGRVCIYGASYGGYATMMGLAKDPDLYRCGVNYAGVTDIDLYLNATWTDYSQSDYLRYTAQVYVGDSKRDAERIKATSPVEQAHRIKVPVLMAYGASDRRVPIEHGQYMRAAMEKNGLKPVWITADGEGHGFNDMKNLRIFYDAMSEFLEQNLKK
jgi:dipeptidyl aminopeptidase/acylaminoacyl peptidase